MPNPCDWVFICINILPKASIYFKICKMIRANIYSLEALPAEFDTAIREGVDLVSAYMGHTVMFKGLQVRLPRNQQGYVAPQRVGFSKLDKMVEMHLMAVPLDRGKDEQLGIASIGRGTAFVDIAHNEPTQVRATAAHEVAHAFGYLLDTAPQRDVKSPRHCQDTSCILHSNLTTWMSDVVQPVSKWAKVRGTLTGTRPTPKVIGLKSEIRQTDFCEACQADFNKTGDEQVNKLRHDRLMGVGKIIFN